MKLVVLILVCSACATTLDRRARFVECLYDNFGGEIRQVSIGNSTTYYRGVPTPIKRGCKRLAKRWQREKNLKTLKTTAYISGTVVLLSAIMKALGFTKKDGRN